MTNMGIAAILVAVIAITGFFLAGFLLKVQLRRQSFKAGATCLEPEMPYDLGSDPFYCLHLKDGSSRHGKIVNFDDGLNNGFTCVMMIDGTSPPGFPKKDDGGGS